MTFIILNVDESTYSRAWHTIRTKYLLAIFLNILILLVL